jgi:hypothetical protein
MWVVIIQVAIATRYYWTVRVSDPARRESFTNPPTPALAPTQPPTQWVPGLFPGSKAAGRGVKHPPTWTLLRSLRSGNRIMMEAKFFVPPQPSPRPNPPPVKWVMGLIPGGKAAWDWRWNPPTFSAEVKERVKLNYSVSGYSHSVLGTIYLYFMVSDGSFPHSQKVAMSLSWKKLYLVTVTPHFFVINFNIFLPPKPISATWSVRSGFQSKTANSLESSTF